MVPAPGLVPLVWEGPTLCAFGVGSRRTPHEARAGAWASLLFLRVRPLTLALLLAFGCAAPLAPPPAPPADVRASPEASPLDACQGDLSGLWRHSKDDGFRYLARDDGGVLILDAQRTLGDGGVESSQVVLVRSVGNFVGAIGVARFLGDAGCAALFPAEVVSCADAGLVVATVDRLRVDGSCRALEQQPGVRRLHRLVHVTPDAGP
jgi:hypothetical protein